MSLFRKAVRVTYAFLPCFIKSNDNWAKTYLTTKEYQLYLSMDVRDRHHSYLVARELLKKHPNSTQVLVKAALLHDVGKSIIKYNPLGRILVHLYTPKNLPQKPYYLGLKGIWQCHLHHAAYGAEMVRDIGGSEYLAKLIANHSLPQNNKEANILHKIDQIF